jgi:hypothetical protein
MLQILANTEQNLIASPKGHPAFEHPWNAKCINDVWGSNKKKGFAITFNEEFLAPVLHHPAGTDTNSDIRAARKYVGPESNLTTFKTVSR